MSGRDKERRPGLGFLRAGAIVLLLTAAAHTAAQLSGGPAPKDEEQATLKRMLESVRFDAGGVERTMMHILSGYSWFFAATLAFVGAATLAMIRGRGGDRGLMRLVMRLNAGFMVVSVVIGAIFFPTPPTGLFAVALVCFLVALWRSRDGSAAGAA